VQVKETLIPIARERRSYVLIKRLLDLTAALIMLLILWPLFLIIAILIKLDSPGPVVFHQTRIGKGGRQFTFYKFRSMCCDAENKKKQLAHLNEVDGPIFKVRNDPRITRVGRLLRKFSLDEFPQLFNVIKGDMSFVGPRPPLPDEVEKYEPWHLERLSVIPGITCTWQISGRSNIGFDDWVKMDLDYIEHRSVLLDIKILLKTIPAVLTGDGAY
jgi:exopolysaccharide biosynthesis polyprenyl glycosylphosphotransferase